MLREPAHAEQALRCEVSTSEPPFPIDVSCGDSEVESIVKDYLIPYVVQSAAYVGTELSPETVGALLVQSADAAMTLS